MNLRFLHGKRLAMVMFDRRGKFTLLRGKCEFDRDPGQARNFLRVHLEPEFFNGGGHLLFAEDQFDGQITVDSDFDCDYAVELHAASS